MAVRRISFVSIATFGLGLFVALAVAVTMVVSGVASVRSTQSLLAERADELLDNIERHVDARLNPVSERARWIARAVAEQRVDLGQLVALDAFMLGTFGTLTQVQSMWIIDPRGVARRWRLDQQQTVVEDVSDRPSTRALLQRGPALSASEWLPPLEADLDRVAVLVHATALRSVGQFVGVLAQVVPLFGLSEDMARISLTSNATTFVLYGRDRVLAHQLLTSTPRRDAGEPLPRVATLGDPVLARFSDPDDTAPFEMRGLVDVQATSVRIGGEQFVFLYRELDRFGPEKLTVGAYINVDSDASWPMKRAVRSVVAGLVVLLLAVASAAYAGRRLSEPVRVLAQAATAAHDGPLAHVPRLPASTIREFDDAAHAFNAMVDGLRERAIIRDTLGKLVSEEVARGLLSGKGELEPVEAKATALLCDIEGFTLLTDSLGPRGVVELLNAYFEVMATIIERHHGVITQFQGDAVLAVFNIPTPDHDHAAHALAAALEMVAAADAFEFAGMRLRNRVGISTGRLIAGAVGSHGRMTYTVHGNAVNLAARIEALNKDFGTRILVSGKTAERCPTFALRRVAEVIVRGYGEPVTLYAPQEANGHPATNPRQAA